MSRNLDLVAVKRILPNHRYHNVVHLVSRTIVTAHPDGNKRGIVHWPCVRFCVVGVVYNVLRTCTYVCIVCTCTFYIIPISGQGPAFPWAMFAGGA